MRFTFKTREKKTLVRCALERLVHAKERRARQTSVSGARLHKKTMEKQRSGIQNVVFNVCGFKQETC